MSHPDEEIYVTLVVVKRPPGSADLDPARWTDLIVNGLVPQGADHRAEVLTRRFARGGHSPRWASPHTARLHLGAAGYGRAPRFKQRRPWLYLALGLLCLGTAAYLVQFLRP